MTNKKNLNSKFDMSDKMTCTIDCENGGKCSFNNTCSCPPCYIGPSCDISMNVIKFSLTYSMSYDSQEYRQRQNLIPSYLLIRLQLL